MTISYFWQFLVPVVTSFLDCSNCSDYIVTMCWQVLLCTMLNEMKSVDETFRELYRQNHYVGSYYENLRVGHPTEFDINLELQLPINESHIEVCFITIMLK